MEKLNYEISRLTLALRKNRKEYEAILFGYRQALKVALILRLPRENPGRRVLVDAEASLVRRQQAIKSASMNAKPMNTTQFENLLIKFRRMEAETRKLLDQAREHLMQTLTANEAARQQRHRTLVASRNGVALRLVR